jgi:hypothetical protein
MWRLLICGVQKAGAPASQTRPALILSGHALLRIFNPPESDFTWGNAGRGLVRAPITWQTDVSLSKTAKLTERLSLQFIAQAFNVFNHDQYADPTIDISSNNFGLINTTVNFNSNNDSFAPDNTGSGTPRQFEFALKLNF